MPEVGGTYTSMEMIIPRGDSMYWGWFIINKQYHKGNPIGGDKPKPILDSQEYTIEFDDIEVTELSTNVIVESMYDQCYNKGNKYVLINYLIIGSIRMNYPRRS